MEKRHAKGMPLLFAGTAIPACASSHGLDRARVVSRDVITRTLAPADSSLGLRLDSALPAQCRAWTPGDTTAQRRPNRPPVA